MDSLSRDITNTQNIIKTCEFCFHSGRRLRGKIVEIQSWRFIIIPDTSDDTQPYALLSVQQNIHSTSQQTLSINKHALEYIRTSNVKFVKEINDKINNIKVDSLHNEYIIRFNKIYKDEVVSSDNTLDILSIFDISYNFSKEKNIGIELGLFLFPKNRVFIRNEINISLLDEENKSFTRLYNMGIGKLIELHPAEWSMSLNMKMLHGYVDNNDKLQKDYEYNISLRTAIYFMTSEKILGFIVGMEYLLFKPEIIGFTQRLNFMAGLSIFINN